MPSRIALTSSTTYDGVIALRIARIAFTSSSTRNRALCLRALLSLCSHLLRDVGWSSRPLRIAHILSTARDVAVLIALLASSLQQGMELCTSSDGAPRLIFRFSSPISRLGWEVFHQINYLVFLPHLPFGLGDFSPNQPSQVFHRTNQVRSLTLITGLTLSAFGFPPQFPTGLGGFSPITYSLILRFSSSVSHWVKGFFIDRSLSYRPHRPPGARSMILRNLVFPPHLPIYSQEVFSTVSHIGYTTSIATRSSELAPKNEGNCNAVATKITWLHLSTGIPLSPPIAFAYQLIPIGLLLGTTKPILLLLGIGFPTLHCWEAHQPSPYFVGTRFSSFVSFFVSSFVSMSVYNCNVVWVKSEAPSDVAWAYPASGSMTRYSVTEDSGIDGTNLGAHGYEGLGLRVFNRRKCWDKSEAWWLGLMARKTNSEQDLLCIR